MNIGSYQLRNLIANRVKFQYFDLRGDSQTESGSAHPLLEGSRKVKSDALVSILADSATPLDGAIVLICADGAVSSALAAQLEAKSYINVFVVDGGVASLTLE